jgi:hypothetical protein
LRIKGPIIVKSLFSKNTLNKMGQYRNKKNGEIVTVCARKGSTVEYWRLAPYIGKQVLCSDNAKTFNNKFEEIK